MAFDKVEESGFTVTEQYTKASLKMILRKAMGSKRTSLVNTLKECL